MAKAVRMYEVEGPEVLRYEDAEAGEPGPGEARLNYADTHFPRGTYPVPLLNGIRIHSRHALQDAVQAHRDVESHKTTGSSIFVA
ncbi:hypothetical protein [Cupriavidus basilensis]|uniref:hypothetical protein n=1 Tax=Cupriavidus basilensis TaxID=68895 RepID=UPI003A599139